MHVRELQRITHASLLAALIGVGAYMAVPIGPVPIVLQNLFVLLAGLLLGSRWGLASVGLYLLLGAIGLPVFSGGRGGMAHFIGPTGGYLLGFALSVFFTGLIAERTKYRPIGDGLAVVVGSLVIYGCGVPWLKIVTGMTWEKAFLAGMLPFLPGDALKAFIAVGVVRALRPLTRHSAQAMPS